MSKPQLNAAQKAWVTRRHKQKIRSDAAKKAWATRRSKQAENS